jgi:hypothetical protein
METVLMLLGGWFAVAIFFIVTAFIIDKCKLILYGLAILLIIAFVAAFFFYNPVYGYIFGLMCLCGCSCDD